MQPMNPDRKSLKLGGPSGTPSQHYGSASDSDLRLVARKP